MPLVFKRILLNKMKHCFTILLAILPFASRAQADSAARPSLAPFQKHSTVFTVSFGLIDQYRYDYSVPAGFEKSDHTGFAPLYAKIEYGISNYFSLAATFTHDGFIYNFNQLYTGYNGIIKRPNADHVNLYNGGVAVFYHLQDVISINHLDPFIGAGAAVNNIHHSAVAQGDTTAATNDHFSSLYLKAGVRYYISSRASLYGDVGYDKTSVISLGFSYWFRKK